MNSKELIKAIDALVLEKGIDADYIYDSLELALQTAYRKNFDSKTNVRVYINRDNGTIKVFTYMIVVEEYIEPTYEEVEDEEGNIVEKEIEPEINRDAQILLEDAKKIKEDVVIGSEIEIEVTPKDFGRVAAGTAKQVVVQKIREAEKEIIINEFAGKENELMMGMVALEDQRNYYIDLGKSRGILPKEEIIPGETIEMGSNIKVYVTKIDQNNKGPVILLSRKHYGFVRRLFESAIPEMVSGDVILSAVVREPGVRSKVAVYSVNSKIDAIGACIGERGSRIASVLKELGTERVDLVLFSEDNEEYIKNAMSPAKDVIVNIIDEEKKEALVIVNEDNLSLAIGKKGSNIKLASRLTRYKLSIKTMEEIQTAGNR